LLALIILGVDLFKRLLVLLCLIFLSSQAFASIYIVEPVDQKVETGQEVFLGNIARGETLKLVVKKKSDLALEWNSLEVDTGLLPQGWTVKTIEEDKSLIALVSLPKKAEASTQRIKVTAKNSSEPLFSEAFYASVLVNEKLLTASIESPSLETMLGEQPAFNLVLNNDSIAAHSVTIESSLPDYWFGRIETGLKPHETKALALTVQPYSYGEKDFSFTVSSEHDDTTLSFPVKLMVKPTLTGIYIVPIAGFPFFSPGMLPFYIINSFLSILG